MTGRDTQAGSNLVIHINKVVDVEKVGPPVGVAVLIVPGQLRPEGPAAHVGHHEDDQHDDHHVHWGHPAQHVHGLTDQSLDA